jgi:regulator of replication initiation timing
MGVGGATKRRGQFGTCQVRLHCIYIFITISNLVVFVFVRSNRYMRADEERTKALNLHIEKLTKELAQSKQNLENEVTETQTAQIELDRTAEDFKKLHLERQALIKQWDEAVKAMARRDQAITQLAEKITGFFFYLFF